MKISKNRQPVFVALALTALALPTLAVQLAPNGSPFIAVGVAAQPCDSTTDSTCNDDADNENAKNEKNVTTPQTELPAEALATVHDLDVKLRYFKAIGFLNKSDAQRESIVAIYEEHGLAVPQKYKK